jgi:RHS repeat-associated protein
MMMPERSETFGSKGYRFAFNGQEGDDEVSGNGNVYDYGARMYNSRMGRWFSTDPVIKPFASPYLFGNNAPTVFIDPDGRDEIYFVTLWHAVVGETSGKLVKYVYVMPAPGKDKYHSVSHDITTSYNENTNRFFTLSETIVDNDFDPMSNERTTLSNWLWIFPRKASRYLDDLRDEFPGYDSYMNRRFRGRSDVWADDNSLKRTDDVNYNFYNRVNSKKWNQDVLNDKAFEFTFEMVTAEVSMAYGLFKYGKWAKGFEFQYSLRAAKDGAYPVMQFGSKNPVGEVLLKKGDYWKFGTNKAESYRYSNKWLENNNLSRFDEFKDIYHKNGSESFAKRH